MGQSYLNLGGTYRSKTPAETLANILPLLKQYQITRVANITGLDNIGIPVFLAIRPGAKHLSVSLGKGFSEELAKISAIMESLELWHAENIPQENLLTGCYQDLCSQQSILDPTKIAHGIYQAEVLKKWQLRWCLAMDLVTQQNLFIPFDAISLDSTSLHKAGLLFQTSGNGLASGNTEEEAICHAIYELIERDCFFHYLALPKSEKKARLMNNATITGELPHLILEKIYQAKLNVKIINIASSLGIPAFQCIITDQSIARNTQMFSGKGCHFDKEVALLRAITEAVQTRLTFISGSRDDVFPSFYQKNVLDQNGDEQGEGDYAAITQVVYQPDFSDNLKQLLQILNNHNFKQVILFRHAVSSANFYVARVIIPGLKVAVEL